MARWKKGAVYYGTSCPMHRERPCMCPLKGIETLLKNSTIFRGDLKREQKRKEDKLVTQKKINETRETCHENCGWRYLFMAQEKHIEAITEESLSIFIKTRDMAGILTDVVQELSSIHTQLDRLSYEKKSEDRLYE